MLSELKTFSPISISWKPVTSRVGNLIVPTFPSSNDVIEIFFDWHPNIGVIKTTIVKIQTLRNFILLNSALLEIVLMIIIE